MEHVRSSSSARKKGLTIAFEKGEWSGEITRND
jgi:hypothetical protein